MKKKIMALILVAALAVSAMSILAVQAAGLNVEVDGANIKVTVSGDTVQNDWVGIYKQGETYGPENIDGVATGNVTSIVWWYITDTTKTIQWPADKAAADASVGGDSASNRAAETLNADFTLKPGKYYAVVLGGADAYTPVAGIDRFDFEIKAPEYTEEETAFNSSIDFINTVGTNGGHGGTEFFVKDNFEFADTTLVSGWLAVEAGIAKYQYSFDGETWTDAQYSISARPDLTKLGLPYEGGHDTAGFDVTVNGTADCTTLYIRAITKDNKVVNFLAFTTGAAEDVEVPSIGDTDNNTDNDNNDGDEPNTETGDVSYLVVVIAMAAILATVILGKKRTEA